MPQAYLRHRDFVSYALPHIAILQDLDACISCHTDLFGGWIDPFARFFEGSTLLN